MKDKKRRAKMFDGDALRKAYEGGFRDGLEASVPGGRMKPNGMEYQGDVNADGQPHGEGVMAWPNGRRYEGEVRDGKPHGEGVMTWADGRRYEGEVRDGKPHGRGVMKWTDGERHDGKFRKGEPVKA